MANTPGPDNHGEAADPGCIRTVLAELVLTFLFVFIGVGSTMSAGRMAGGAGSIAGLTAAAVAHSLAAAVLVTAGFHLSGGHLNPAVTVSLAVSGRMTVVRSVLYVAAQVLGSSLACLLLRGLTGGLATPVHALGTGMGPMQGVLMEIIFTFTMLFLVYATILDPRTSVPGLGPLLTGLLVGANTLSGGAFSGASMNPARSFGPALATGVWTHHWVYWVGPLTGGPLAVLVYEFVFMDKRRHGRMHEPLLGE